MTIERLEAALGLKFRDPGLLQQALVHRSFLNEQAGEPPQSYERLEFLGDAVIEITVSAELFRRFPLFTEGELTKQRAELVRTESLAGLARRLGIGEFLALGKGEEATGGRERDSILAASFEAVAAAVYLDLDYDHAKRFVLRLLEPQLDALQAEGPPLENSKSRLQEHVQGMGIPSPRYNLISTEGPDHAPSFTVEVLVDGQAFGVGRGGRRNDAEQNAAADALRRLLGL